MCEICILSSPRRDRPFRMGRRKEDKGSGGGDEHRHVACLFATQHSSRCIRTDTMFLVTKPSYVSQVVDAAGGRLATPVLHGKIIRTQNLLQHRKWMVCSRSSGFLNPLFYCPRVRSPSAIGKPDFSRDTILSSEASSETETLSVRVRSTQHFPLWEPRFRRATTSARKRRRDLSPSRWRTRCDGGGIYAHFAAAAAFISTHLAAAEDITLLLPPRSPLTFPPLLSYRLLGSPLIWIIFLTDNLNLMIKQECT